MTKMSDTPQDRSADGVPGVEQEPIRTNKRFSTMTMSELRTLVKRLGYHVTRHATWDTLAVYAELAEAEGRVVQPALEIEQERRCVRTDGSHVNHFEPVDGMSCDPNALTDEDRAVADRQRAVFASPTTAPGTGSDIADEVAALRAGIEALHVDYRYPELRFESITARLDRIAALVPQRATNRHGELLWQHYCGAPAIGGREDLAPQYCPGCRLQVGAWRALYTL